MVKHFGGLDVMMGVSGRALFVCDLEAGSDGFSIDSGLSVYLVEEWQVLGSEEPGIPSSYSLCLPPISNPSPDFAS